MSLIFPLASQLHPAVVEMRRMSTPVVAAINGAAAGADFALTLASDFRIMEQSAVLKQASTSNGLSFDGDAPFTLPNIAGLARALEIAAFDPAISSVPAAAWGLATQVVEGAKSLKNVNRFLTLKYHIDGYLHRRSDP
ncbi:MAG: hypothetical protein JSW39_27540 [Desulfobacterales bacterium]|nr:MAG: hypothetical protein JSW39_27540 [Desulfobacterales bacterium]